MPSTTKGPNPEPSRLVTIPRVIVATTAMLTFISFWRAAAIVLNDLASSAYYAGGEAEQFIGRPARGLFLRPWLFPSPFPRYSGKAAACSSGEAAIRGVRRRWAEHRPNFPSPRSWLTTFV